MFISNSPRLFAGNHVLLRLSVPRHSPYALFRLNSLACSLSRSRVTRSKFRSCLSFANNCLGCNEKTVLSNILHHCFPPPGFPPTANCSSLFRKDLFLSSKLQLSVRFFPYSVFNEQSLPHPILADRMRCRRRPIFPCCYRQSIFGSPELNFRVRNGNGWTLRDAVPTLRDHGP